MTLTHTNNFLYDVVDRIVDHIDVRTVVEFNEGRRYVPQSVSRFSGYISFDLMPWWKEILDCFSMSSPVREVSVMKGVQTGYTTALESILFYFIGYIRTLGGMFFTADDGLSEIRLENNIIPMLHHSGMSDVFQSADTGDNRKAGKTKKMMQFVGGGFLIPGGARNADKMRQTGVPYMFMDEISAWAQVLARGGNPVGLCKDRCSSFWLSRKILMGSTPLLQGSCHIETEYNRGDKRMWNVHCLKCGLAQVLRFSGKDDHGKDYGIKWDYLNGGELDIESVRYHCRNCGHPHQEHDKPRLFEESNGFWEPTSTSVEPGVRSYHLPALYSAAGIQPWSKCVASYLSAFDEKTGRVKDVTELQRFYNNILGVPFEVMDGVRVSKTAVSSHRRQFYKMGEIPNTQIERIAPSRVQCLTCAVDVHKDNLAVAVLGWTRGHVTTLVDYFRIYDHSEAGCAADDSPVWGQLREIIEERIYVSNDGKKYPILGTVVDSGFSNSRVVEFCSEYYFGVWPIVGREKSVMSTNEFSEFKTQAGTVGFKLNTDYYKDRIATALRREWLPDMGVVQGAYHFNAPMDTTDDQLYELTKETRKNKTLPNGRVVYYWHRPNGAKNELWDLLVYNHGCLSILASIVCKNNLGMDGTDFETFFNFIEENGMGFK